MLSSTITLLLCNRRCCNLFQCSQYTFCSNNFPPVYFIPAFLQFQRVIVKTSVSRFILIINPKDMLISNHQRSIDSRHLKMFGYLLHIERVLDAVTSRKHHLHQPCPTANRSSIAERLPLQPTLRDTSKHI